MKHSFEEIRTATLQVLGVAGQYNGLKDALAQHLERQLGAASPNIGPVWVNRVELSDVDANIFLEVFWGLFREGIITLGMNDSNPNFPFYRVSEFGRKLLADQNEYFFHDVASYEAQIKSRVPDIDAVTLLYLKEAMQAFKTGCLLSSSVMVGVALEHSFLLMLEVIENNPVHSVTYSKAVKERMILKKIVAFQEILDRNIQVVPSKVREDLDTQLFGIMSMIRAYRNEAGHPTGNIISREQCFVNLQLFITCCQKIYQLKAVFV